MKKITLVVWAFILLVALNGCGTTSRQYQIDHSLAALKGTNVQTTKSLIGLVPVDFENAAGPFYVRVLLFEGSALVTLVPDARTGQWQYSRPAFFEFEMKPSFDYNWREYVRINLPHNSNFVAVARAGNFWGWGKPYYTSFRTGSDPFSYSYTSVTPTSRRVDCGAFVPLRPEAISVGERLNLQVTIDTTQWGRAIADSIVEWLWR